MSPSTTALTLDVRPRQRVDLIDVARQIAEQHGDLLGRFPRALYCSHHTTAGFLPQSMAARLQHSRDQLDRFLAVFRRIFPPDADYRHDQMPLRDELSHQQKLVEPKNADSHLAFIGSGLASCVSYTNHPDQPVYFIDLDGINGPLERSRRATVLAYHREREVATLDVEVPVSHHAADSICLREERLGLLSRLDEMVAGHGIATGRIEIGLHPEERWAGLTVNEYETLLMRHDLSEVLEDPFRFMAEKGRHILANPLAVPYKTLSYAKYDLVHVYNELLEVLRISESSLARLLARLTGGAASRFLRLGRAVSLAVHPREGGGEILLGQYQSPILVQWRSPERQVRRLRATLFELA